MSWQTRYDQFDNLEVQEPGTDCWSKSISRTPGMKIADSLLAPALYHHDIRMSLFDIKNRDGMYSKSRFGKDPVIAKVSVVHPQPAGQGDDLTAFHEGKCNLHTSIEIAARFLYSIMKSFEGFTFYSCSFTAVPNWTSKLIFCRLPALQCRARELA